jgi:YhcH/YjgK/YiaL family protein
MKQIKQGRQRAMVIDHIKNASLYYGLGKGIEAGLNYLNNTDFTAMAPGKYPIDGDAVFALVQIYDSKLPEACKWEAHRRFIDIQFIAQGAELMGYAGLESLRVAKEYDAENDYLLLQGKGSMLYCGSGTFAIFAPGDAHMPGVAADAPQAVKKVVIKVLI